MYLLCKVTTKLTFENAYITLTSFAIKRILKLVIFFWTHVQKSPTLSQKEPYDTPKIALHYVKRDLSLCQKTRPKEPLCQKRHSVGTICQKRPTFYQKRPTFPYSVRRALYFYILSKEPCIPAFCQNSPVFCQKSSTCVYVWTSFSKS